MSRSSNQRLKILYLLRLLEEHTDENHALTMAEIIEHLAVLGIRAERKSIYSDMDLLRNCGYEIEKSRSKIPDYRLLNRSFELPELKLLADAVQSAYFLTEKKSKELVSKLTSLTSRHQATQLQRQVHIIDRPKSLNERVYYNVDAIHAGISQRKIISFRYFEYDLDKNSVYHKEGDLYFRMPLALCWNNDNYYLVCYSSKHEGIAHYRVDRMDSVEVTRESLDGYEHIHANFDLAAHTNKAFDMFNGESIRAILRFDNSLVNVVLDQFGTKIFLYKSEEYFDIHVEVFSSPTFFGWMFQFGDKAEIVSPIEFRTKMRELAQRVEKHYC